MADDAKGLIAQAERDAEAGDVGAALKALDRAYVPVQKDRDLDTVRQALVLARRIASEESLGGRERRKVRNIVENYMELERSYSGPYARPAPRTPAARAELPSLGWIDGLVVVLAGFVALVLLGGGVVVLAASRTAARVDGIVVAGFWATMLLALIAILRLLQRIERNTRPGEPTSG